MSKKTEAYTKMAITSNTVSCGKCDKAVLLSECEEKEEKLNNEFYSYRLSLKHKSCGSIVAGADV